MKLLTKLVLLLLIICQSLGHGQEIIDGGTKTELKLPSGNRAWVYLPSKSNSELVPCVLIAPAGSGLYHGMDLASGDSAEHIPYLKAGFAVVAYDLSGSLEKFKVKETAVLQFIKSRGGVLDAAAALKLATQSFPSINGNQVYVAGHSSAAVVALAIARTSPTIKGCIAYCPPVKVRQKLEGKLAEFRNSIPVIEDFFDSYCPSESRGSYHCPVMFFSCRDDRGSANSSFVRALANRLKEKGEKIVQVEVPTGGHYQSMIESGIPKGIEFIRAIEAGGTLPEDSFPVEEVVEEPVTPSEKVETSAETEVSPAQDVAERTVLIIALLLGFVALVWSIGCFCILFDAFTNSVGWGISCLFVPFVHPLYMICHLKRPLNRFGAKLVFFSLFFCVALFVVGICLSVDLESLKAVWQENRESSK